MHGRAIREDEVFKHALKIGSVEIGDVPEDTLITTGSGRLIEAVDYLLKGISDHLVDGAAACGQICLLIGVEVVVIAVFSTNEVVHVAEPFRGGDGAAELACLCEDQIDERPIKGRQIFWRFTGAADTGVALEQEWIQRDGSTVGLAYHSRFIMTVDLMLLQLAEIFFGKVGAVHFLQLVVHRQTVNSDGIPLVELRLLCGDVLLLHVGIGIHLAGSRSVGRSAIARDEVQMRCASFVLVNSHGQTSFLSARQGRLRNSSGFHRR